MITSPHFINGRSAGFATKFPDSSVTEIGDLDRKFKTSGRSYGYSPSTIMYSFSASLTSGILLNNFCRNNKKAVCYSNHDSSFRA